MRANGFIHRLMAGAVVLAISGVAAVLGGVAANAAPPPGDGHLTLVPATGLDTTLISLTTPTGCPTGSTDSYNGLVHGVGTAAGFDGTVVNTQTAHISFTGPFPVEFSNTMLAVSQSIGKPIKAGEYDISLNCVDSFLGTVGRTFTTAMYFTDATHWTLTSGGTPTSTATPTASATPTPASSEKTTTSTNSTTPSTTAPSITSGSDTTTPATSMGDGVGTSTSSDPPAGTHPIASTDTLANTGAPIGLIFIGGLILFAAGLALVFWLQRLRKAALSDGGDAAGERETGTPGRHTP